MIVTYQTSNLIAPCCHESHKTDSKATPGRDGFAFVLAAYTATGSLGLVLSVGSAVLLTEVAGGEDH
jgi:hypothetical protein